MTGLDTFTMLLTEGFTCLKPLLIEQRGE